ncbi:MAG TPA: hypothetical protein VF808_10815 [Ktedonobacterales bacterium]
MPSDRPGNLVNVRADHSANMRDGGMVRRGMWAGATPLLLAVAILVIAIGSDALARALAFSAGFFVWRRIVEVMFLIGLFVAAIVYGFAAARALRLAARWRDAGLTRQAASVYWTLLLAAALVVAPVVFALLAPQHPAP